MSTNLVPQSTLPSSKNTYGIPNCLIIPSSSGSLTNCITMKMPSISTLIVILVISWIIYLMVAYVIYYFLNKANPSMTYNYWIILGILLLSGFIISLFFW